MANDDRREARKPWKEPKLPQLQAGSAENTSSGSNNDGATTGPKKS